MQIKFKKIHPNAVLPTNATPDSNGFDLVATEELESPPYTQWFSLGIASEIPQGYCGLIFPRSSITKTRLMLGNCVGIVDADFRAAWQVRFNQINPHIQSEKYKVGDRVAQVIFIKTEDIEPIFAEELSETVRNQGGFGSTGK